MTVAPAPQPPVPPARTGAVPRGGAGRRALPAAGAGKRIAAYLIDAGLVAAAGAAAWLLTGSPFVAALVAVEIVVGVVVWEGHSGCTAGQLALGLRTVRLGTPESAGVQRVIPRALVFGASHVFVVGPLVLLLTAAAGGKSGQAWHDKVGDLQVVDARRAARERRDAVPQPFGFVAGRTVAPSGPAGAPPHPPGSVGVPPSPSVVGAGRHPVPPPPPLPRIVAPGSQPPAAAGRAAAAAPHGHPPSAPGGGADVSSGGTPTSPQESRPSDAPPQRRRRDRPVAGPTLSTATELPRRIPSEASAAPPAALEPESPPQPHEAPEIPLHTQLPSEFARAPRRAAPGEPARASAGPAPAFRLDDGEIVRVDRGGYIGRRPSAPEGPGEALLVTVPDPDRSLSRTHGRFGLKDGRIWFEDLGSGNGSALTLPDGRSGKLTPHQRIALAPGTRLHLGARVVEVIEA